MDVLVNLGLVVLFVLLGGFFAGAEIALVSLRSTQASVLAQRGGRGRRVARLRADSNRFLSAVQIGVTFCGFFASSYGGATIAGRLEPWLARAGLPLAAAATVALVVVTLLVSYLSIVLGELVPKRLALQRTEAVSLATAGILDRFASLTRPVIWLLSRSTNAVVRLLGIDPRTAEDRVGEDELRDMVRTSGTLTTAERRLLSDALSVTDQTVREALVPRTEVDFLVADDSVTDAVATIEQRPHSRYPVIGDGVDDVLGYVHVRDLLSARSRREPGSDDPALGDLARPVTVLPGSNPLLGVLAAMRRGSTSHLAVVVDEYGGTAGIVTIEDLVEEIVGEIRDEHDPSAGPVRPVPGGGVDADGLTDRDDLEEQTGIELPDGSFETLGGFVLHALGRSPEVGDAVEAADHRFTVAAVDGHRVSRVRVTPTTAPDDRSPASEGADESER